MNFEIKLTIDLPGNDANWHHIGYHFGRSLTQAT